MAAEASRAAQPIDGAQLLDALATAVMVIDERSRVVHLNIAAEDLLAVSIATARGKRIAELLVRADRLEALVVRARVGGEALTQRA